MITKEYLQQELEKRIKGYKSGVETSTDNIIAEMKSILVLVDALPDYEKKYNEALERFKAFKEKYYTKNTVIGDTIFDKTEEMQRDFESIFPQLRESEDERIRKWLVDYFSSIKETIWIHRDITCEQILEYLEKQKEQKPAEWSEEDEKMLDAMIDIVSGSFYEPLCPRKEMLAWLKSLRPSWKPSEEQVMKEAVEGKIIFLLNGDVAINIGDTEKYNLGDKVRIIIVKED